MRSPDRNFPRTATESPLASVTQIDADELACRDERGGMRGQIEPHLEGLRL
jgi:hypothetical protein